MGRTDSTPRLAGSGEIASYGVMRTPGLVVDEQVLVSGRVPDAKEIAVLLSA